VHAVAGATSKDSWWRDEELVPLSALEHWSYCPRQCALIHLDQTFEESVHTLRGQRVHERADSGEPSMSQGIRVVRGLPLWSGRLGLTGRADIVEFGPGGPCPVEYKSGKQRPGEHESLQVCAQAMCLEEMLGEPVAEGAIWWHGSRSRQIVRCDAVLRQAVEQAVDDVREMMREQRLPGAFHAPRCRACSLRDVCLPVLCADERRVREMMSALFMPGDDD
jgi:CRISPR-associated exonuclease Cas4